MRITNVSPPVHMRAATYHCNANYNAAERCTIYEQQRTWQKDQKHQGGANGVVDKREHVNR